jgi:hypothetical protein
MIFFMSERHDSKSKSHIEKNTSIEPAPRIVTYRAPNTNQDFCGTGRIYPKFKGHIRDSEEVQYDANSSIFRIVI